MAAPDFPVQSSQLRAGELENRAQEPSGSLRGSSKPRSHLCLGGGGLERAVCISAPTKAPAWEPGGDGAPFPFIIGLPARAAGLGSERGRQSPRRSRRRRAGAGVWPVSAAPRRAAPRAAREPRARAPRTPRPARAGPSPALPRPGAGAARGRLPELGGRTRECEREGPGPLRRQRGGGAAGSPARRGGARRAALGAGLGAVSALTAEVRARTAMNSAARLGERARAGPPGCGPSQLAACAAPRTPGPAPAHARPRSHRAAAGRPHILELAGARSTARARFRAAPPAARRPRARLADGPGPFRTPGPRLPAAWHSHRHSPWAPHARCTQAGDGMDAGRGGTVGGSVFWIFFFF